MSEMPTRPENGARITLSRFWALAAARAARAVSRAARYWSAEARGAMPFSARVFHR